MENIDNQNNAKPTDLLEIDGFWEEREKHRKNVWDNDKFQKQLNSSMNAWEQQIVDKYPELKKDAQILEILQSAIRELSFIDYFTRNELKTADAPLLQPRIPDSDEPLFKEGIEDLIEKFLSGNFEAAVEQAQTAIRIIDNSAFSVKHNIHLGLVPLYMIRESAIGLSGNIRALKKKIIPK